MTKSAEPSTPSGSPETQQRRRQITSYKNTTTSPATDRSSWAGEPCGWTGTPDHGQPANAGLTSGLPWDPNVRNWRRRWLLLWQGIEDHRHEKRLYRCWYFGRSNGCRPPSLFGPVRRGVLSEPLCGFGRFAVRAVPDLR